MSVIAESNDTRDGDVVIDISAEKDGADVFLTIDIGVAGTRKRIEALIYTIEGADALEEMVVEAVSQFRKLKAE